MPGPIHRVARDQRSLWSMPQLLAVAAILSACGLSGATGTGNSSGAVEVVVAENVWGSIVSQLGGAHVHVTSVITNPSTDPHAYEAKPADARTIAQAKYVIVNGAGYDPWAPKLLDANPVPSRQVLTVGDVLGKKEGDNPHFWYSPEYVGQVIDRITADLKQIDPADASYFDEQGNAYKTVGLKDYKDTIATIREEYAGTPVGATESIFVYLAQPLGLNLVTPAEYMKAISEGTDPSAADKVTIDRQIAQRQIRVFVFNSQNTTPDVNAYVDKARAHNIPVAAVTETLTPATASFQDWQTGQLKNLLKALGS
jgi:zinc/manganese transport system substrate-binding protein